LGEQLAISLAYPDYSRKSAFMVNKLNDYFLGGMDDMAVSVYLAVNIIIYHLSFFLNYEDMDSNKLE
jgi:hypothetical protein